MGTSHGPASPGPSGDPLDRRELVAKADLPHGLGDILSHAEYHRQLPGFSRGERLLDETEARDDVEVSGRVRRLNTVPRPGGAGAGRQVCDPVGGSELFPGRGANDGLDGRERPRKPSLHVGGETDLNGPRPVQKDVPCALLSDKLPPLVVPNGDGQAAGALPLVELSRYP